ncbi:MAG: penicillin-binding protein 2, partial [Candidatus Andersenbacteria bacterium]
TIDRVVQSIIEEELKSGVEKYGAERGSVIIMHPQTGAILGMATYPTFDPNYYYAISDAKVQLNPTVSEIFEPGSILKPVIMAAALEEGTATPDTTFVDNGPVQVAEYRIDTFDGKHHGTQTMTQVLEQSNNIGMVWVAQQLGAEVMYDYFRRFGLGEKTGVELEGETQNQLPDPTDWNVTTVATTSFGQGIALTPLQALNAINVLANEGKLMQPRIVDEVRYSDGKVEESAPQAVRQVVSGETADKLAAMMVSVIENGVATLARVPGYYLAGKTGTAQVPDERGKYSADRKIISFVGFGPVEDPKFSVLIKLDNPAGLSLASGTAAPMFKNISEKILKYYQIPPSYEATQRPKFKVTDTTNGRGT